LRGDGLEEIAKEFGLHHYSSISNARERVHNQLLQDRRNFGDVVTYVAKST